MPYEAPNVLATKKIVYANRGLFSFLGTYGDPRHQSGRGDHTRYSSHRGKYGYPTRGYVHAIDFNSRRSVIASLEYWLRMELRAGRVKGLKYFNCLNRHWNLQTLSNYNLARAGRLRPTYSGDVHMHWSFENGSIDRDLLTRYIRYRSGAPSAPSAQVATSTQATAKQIWDYKIDSSLYGAPKAAADLLKYGYILTQQV